MTSNDKRTWACRTFAAQPYGVLVMLARAFGVSPQGTGEDIAVRLVDAGAVPGESFR